MDEPPPVEARVVAVTAWRLELLALWEFDRDVTWTGPALPAWECLFAEGTGAAFQGPVAVTQMAGNLLELVYPQVFENPEINGWRTGPAPAQNAGLAADTPVGPNQAGTATFYG